MIRYEIDLDEFSGECRVRCVDGNKVWEWSLRNARISIENTAEERLGDPDDLGRRWVERVPTGKVSLDLLGYVDTSEQAA
jgi:hypothetical protein